MKPYRISILIPGGIKVFNIVIYSSRTCIEYAFGALKGLFGHLKGIKSINVTLVSQTTVACYILHNVCVKQGKINFF